MLAEGLHQGHFAPEVLQQVPVRKLLELDGNLPIFEQTTMDNAKRPFPELVPRQYHVERVDMEILVREGVDVGR